MALERVYEGGRWQTTVDPGGGSLPDPITVPVEISPADMDARAGFKLTTPLGSFLQWINAAFDSDAADGAICLTTSQPGNDGEYLVKLISLALGELFSFDSDGATQITIRRDSAAFVIGSTLFASQFRVLADGRTDLSGAAQVRVDPNGVDPPKLGFFDKAQSNTPAEQPVVPLTTPTVQGVIDALLALGLVSQSD